MLLVQAALGFGTLGVAGRAAEQLIAGNFELGRQIDAVDVIGSDFRLVVALAGEHGRFADLVRMQAVDLGAAGSSAGALLPALDGADVDVLGRAVVHDGSDHVALDEGFLVATRGLILLHRSSPVESTDCSLGMSRTISATTTDNEALYRF